MIYHEVIGDLFNVPQSYSLAHCISADCKMGAGIALEFTKHYPHMKKKLSMQRYNVSDVIFYEQLNSHCVFNLITKEKYYHKPKREDFNETILNLKTKLIELSIDKLAIPLLGAGLDKLNWDVSKEFIKQCFQDTSVEILVVRLK